MTDLTYSEAVAFIHNRTKFKKLPTLERMRDFCKRIGNPEKKLRMIHITGTNGKGSTAAFCRQLLMEKGFKVGSFTSPFIIKLNDRFCINNQMISDQKLTMIVNQLLPIIEQMDHDWQENGGGPTQFEINTAIMLKYFAMEHVDYAVIEVGLGGTYDATNVITPFVSVITTVGEDHLSILGPTLKEVAKNKAGIIKNEVPVVLGKVSDEARKVILTKANQEHSSVLELGKDIQVVEHPSSKWGERFDYHYEEMNLHNIEISLMGQYQINNAALALSAVLKVAQHDHWQLTANEIKKSLKDTNWPGRFERINERPLIILDGAHNEPAIKELTTLLKTRFKNQKINIIMSILEDKQSALMLQELLKIANVDLTLTTFDSPRPLVNLQQMALKFPQIQVIHDWRKALVEVIATMDSDDVLLFSGSLYFISEVRNYFVNSKED